MCGYVGVWVPFAGTATKTKTKKPRSPRLPPRSPPSIPPLSSPRSLPLPALTQAKSLEGHVPTVIPGAPGWSEKLASDSEAVVKAERAAAEAGVPGAPASPGEDVGADVKVLVQHTVALLREEAFIDRVVGETEPVDRKREDPLTRGSSPL